MSDPSNETDDRDEFEDLFITTASASRERAGILPRDPSEDARHVLGEIRLEEAPPWDEERDYLPAPAVEWVVDVRLEGDPNLDPQSIDKAFDSDWRRATGGFTAYGRDVETGRWTYLISADGPKVVDQLKFAFDYIDILDDDAPLPGEREYADRLEQIAARLKSFGAPTVTASLAPVEAAQRSQLLRDVKDRLDVTVVLILEAPQGRTFDGKSIWDVMLCLGLEWGDMDCFHWENPSRTGDDSFFSIETTTPPGYFLPEEIAADRVHVSDLVFVYSLPRCARPVEVFEAMTRAVEYCQSRLGGSIVDEDGRPVDTAAYLQQVGDAAAELRSAGFEPGADATLRLF